jgi:uncharacterized protein YndB with AHSA1/START domain
MTVSHVECNPIVGGRYSINMVAQDGSEHRAVGCYIEVSPYSKLSFTWDWEVGGDPAEGSQVTVLLKEFDQDNTELTLIHERLFDATSRDGHIGGWTGALTNLENYLT